MQRFFVLTIALTVLPVCDAWACKFTPLEWQQRVEQHVGAEFVSQRKHTTWIRDLNRNFIDDAIDARFTPGELVDVIVDLNTCLSPPEIHRLLSRFGRITYIQKLVSSVMMERVRFEDMAKLAALPQVAMVEWQSPVGLGNDVGTRSTQSRASVTFSPNTAQDAGFNGTGVTIAVIDTGVDDAHQSFTGKFVAGFDASIFEDTNGNQIDDSCEPAPLGNGVCTDADDEPANGTTNPPDNHSHGTHVAGIALGAPVTGATCSAPDDGSAADCAGSAAGARLVDIRICAPGCPTVDMVEALDWLGINAATFNVRVATMSVGGVSGTNDDGTSSRAQQLNYLASLGIFFAVLHHNAPNTGVAPGTQIVDTPQSASFAMTVAGTNDRNTVARTDDTNYSGFLRGPRTDFNVMTPNLLALKPDIAAPGENIFSSQTGTAAGFFSQSGTSMATPNVAGAAAVIIQARPTIDPGSLKDLLKRSADTSQNTAAFPAVDPNWDNDLGSGMLNVWNALAASTTDVRFPNCVGPPSSPGQPCALTPPMPSWNNTADISTAAAPQVGVANTITAQVRNNGAVPATILVNFGVYIFAVGNNQFFHIGTQQVTIPAMTTMAVNQAWTPAATNHQCIQVSIDFGLDTDYTNNVTQRNLQVAPSVFEVQIENPFFVPARIQVQPKSDRDGWVCKISAEEFTHDPFADCPHKLRVTFDPPANARPGDRANCNIAVLATPRGTERARPIGGVTVQTFVPRPCRVVGTVVDVKGNPIRGARLTFARAPREEEVEAKATRGATARPVLARTDADGFYSLALTPYVRQIVTIEAPGVGKGQLVLRPECGAGKLNFVLDREHIRVVTTHAIRVAQE